MSEPLATLLRLLAVVVLIGLNGFFVATEFALVAMRRTRIDELVDRGVAGAVRVRRAQSDLNRFIAATQLGITMASLGLGWLGEPAVAGLLQGVLGWIPGAVQPQVVAGVIAFVLITGLHIVFGELAPKSIALTRPERTALVVVTPTSLFLAAFRPAIALLNSAGAAVVRLLGIAPPAGFEASLHSPEEIEQLVEQSARGGAMEDAERRMIRGVFDIGDRTARHAMVPRTQVKGLPLTAGLKEAVARALAAHHSRLPVYEGDLDHIVGMVHLRDLVVALTSQSDEAFSLRRLLRPAPAVPDGLMLDEVLVVLREARTHLAVVVDEYGGTAGILTLEDIMEEIVGEVPDEFDPQGPEEIAPQPDGSWLLDGLLPPDEVDEQLGTHLQDASDADGEPLDVDTLGGLVVALLGRLAVVGDEVVVPSDPPVVLRVEEVVDRRVARVRLRFVKPREAGAPSESDAHAAADEG
ncbi:MAG: hypothetical protein JWO42_2057 [Chloroflexi bacterium]|nr:hypothetical protein [Chloroflexota bacterium]